MPDTRQWAERMKEEQRQEAERWDKLKAIAQKQGLMLVKLSDRRFMIIGVHSDSGGIRFIEGRNTYHTWLSGDVVFGPAAIEDCLRYISVNTDPLPRELLLRK